jgi:hypothetical protein
MDNHDKKHLLLLRVFLISAALASGCSVLGLVLPWHIVDKQLTGYGAQPIDDPMVIYWLKMAAAVYTLLGCFFLLVAVRPAKYHITIAPIAYFHLILAPVLLINGLILGIHPIPLYIDAALCLCVGLGIFATNRKLKQHFELN